MLAVSCLFWSFVVLLSMLFLGLFFALTVLAIREILLGRQSRSWRRGMRGVALLAVILLAVVLLCAVPLKSIRECLEAPYSNPSPTLQDPDLVGTWEARYGLSVDTLTLKADGSFKQVYTDHYNEGYVYETGWNRWSVQRLGDGRVRLQLHGARFYQDGIAVAEEGGWGHGTQSFYDPISVRTVDMEGKLVLNVRADPAGHVILYHMWSTGDQGFAMTGCEGDIFRRVEEP